MQKKIVSRLGTFLAVVLPCCLQAAWTTPVEICQTYVDQPSITVNASGNAVAVWQGYDGSNRPLSKLTNQALNCESLR